MSVTDPWIRVDELGGAYDVAVVAQGSPGGSGSVHGAVTMAGAAGTVHVPVTVGTAGGPTTSPGPEPEPLPATVAQTRRGHPGGTAGRPAPPERPPRAGRLDRIRRAAWLAIGAGAVLAVVLVANALAEDVPVELAYVLHPGLLVAGGVCILRPSSRTLGLGLVTGAGGAAVLPAVLLATAIGAHAIDQRRWALVVVLVVLLCVVAAALAAAAAARCPAPDFARRC